MRLEERPDEDPVELPLSQVDLAAIVGVTRQTLHPLVKSLEKQGLIEARFGIIRILDRARFGAAQLPAAKPVAHGED